MPKCKFCQNDIRWKYLYKAVPPGEKNLPLNMDGSLHDCRPKKEEKLTEEDKKEILKKVIKRIEKDPFPPAKKLIAFENKLANDPMQIVITELTKHTHLLEAILEAVKK